MKSKILVLSSLTFLLSCKQSNKELFEVFTDITIPSSAKIINDEYQDMGQDYGKVLEVQLDQKAQSEIELSIRKSHFFNESAIINSSVINPELLRTMNQRKGVWYKDAKGYAFYGSTNNKRENVIARIDTVQRIVSFQYLAD